MHVAGGLTAGWLLLAALALPAWGMGQSGQEAGQASAPAPAATGSEKESSKPKLIYSVNPEYTDKARKKKLSGRCLLSLTVDVNGVPQDIVVVQSIADTVSKKMKSTAEGLDENAVKAVRQYRFRPALSNGKPVPAALQVEVQFQIF